MYCVKCETEKPDSEFYPMQKSECKACTRVRVRNNRSKRIDYYREYDRNRGNRQGRSYTKEYRKHNPAKYKATCAVNNAIRDGRLTREPCEVCGTTEKVHAHHDDYAKPLDVRWLCAAHHRQWHIKHGEAKNSELESA